jgi:hypothetical protein
VLDANADRSIEVPLMHETTEPTQVERARNPVGAIHVARLVKHQMAQVLKRLDDRALPRAVRAKKQSDGPQLNTDARRPDGLEVLDFEAGDHEWLCL